MSGVDWDWVIVKRPRRLQSGRYPNPCVQPIRGARLEVAAFERVSRCQGRNLRRSQEPCLVACARRSAILTKQVHVYSGLYSIFHVPYCTIFQAWVRSTIPSGWAGHPWAPTGANQRGDVDRVNKVNREYR